MMKKFLKKFASDIKFLLFLTGWIVYSSINFFSLFGSIKNAQSSQDIITTTITQVSNQNDAVLQKLKQDSIVVTDVHNSVDTDYYIEDNYLYDKNNENISLTGSNQAIHFISIPVEPETLLNIDLANSQTSTLSFDYSGITSDCISYFPRNVTNLSLNYCSYLDSLDELPDRCPNITYLSLNCTTSLSNLDFIYRLPNLQEILLGDSTQITAELLNYLKEKNIKTNITEQAVVDSQKIDEISQSILKEGMNDKEKIQAICLYILENMEYDLEFAKKSNQEPISCFLENAKGVCITYSHLAKSLLGRAGIQSYVVTNSSHGWNIVLIDGRYYYIDLTNMDDSQLNHFLLKYFNVSANYLTDTERFGLSPMTKASDEDTLIPTTILEEIKRTRKTNNWFQNNFNSGTIINDGTIILNMLSIMFTITSPAAIFMLIKFLPLVLPHMQLELKKMQKDEISLKLCRTKKNN